MHAYIAAVKVQSYLASWKGHASDKLCIICSVNDVEEKYYADGEDAYDMRKPFKQLKHKAAPVKQLQPAPSPNTQAEKDTGASQQNAAPSVSAAQDKHVHPQAKDSTAAAESENTDKSAAPQAKMSQSKTKGARSKKR